MKTVDHDPELPPAARAILDEEKALLVRVSEALAKAWAKAPATRGGELRSRDALRELRDEAVSARDDDLPAMLQEMTVRKRLVERAEKELPDPDSPYLAHMVVDEGKGPRDYLLGKATFLDAAADVRVVDWRVAPIAQVFYRYREGDEFEETLPGRVAKGVVTARRVIVIEKGELTRVVCDDLTLARGADGRWSASGVDRLKFAGGGTGTAARPGELGVGIGVVGTAAGADVTSLLDADQYAAITAPPEHPLLVVGSAGSGKTTVALHRLSRIAANDPANYPLARMQVVVPEQGLARLSRRLLDAAGARDAHVTTLDAWSRSLARDLLEKRLSVAPETPPLVTSLKRHPALYRAMARKYSEKGTSVTSIGILRRRLAEVFSDRGFLDAVVADAAGSLRKTAIEETVRHTMQQIARTTASELRDIADADRKVAVDGRSLADGTPEELAGTIDVEDVPILLCMRAWRDGIEPGSGGWSHLVLDEAEDVSLFELFLARTLLGDRKSVTLSGDDAQQTTSSFSGWPEALETLGAPDAEMCRLAVSYRCPRPIAELSRALLGTGAPEAPSKAAREGAPVGFFRFPNEELSNLFIAGALRELLAREPRASVGVIAHDALAARRVYESFADLEARLVFEGTFGFEPGIDVTHVDDVKGLEFDYVVIPDANAATYPANDEARRRLHVAATRASHQLWIVSDGPASPLLAGLDA